MRGGLRPLSVLKDVPQVPPRGFTERSSFRLGFAHRAEWWVTFGFGAPSWLIFRIFRIFSHLVSFFGASEVITCFFFEFFIDFGWISEGFGEGFGWIFRRFFALLLKMPILQNIAFSHWKINKIKGWSLRKSIKNR